MTKKLQHVFALSEKGAKDLVKAVIWCFVCNVSLMIPVGVVLFTVQHLLDSMENENNPANGFWMYTGLAAVVLFLLFLLLQTHKVNDLDQTSVTMVTGAVADTLWCWVTLCSRTELEGLVTIYI